MINRIDVLITDALVFDGSFAEPSLSHVAISGEKIVYVGNYRAYEAETVINAKGLAVSPGFIDTHAHSDFSLIADPRAEGKICQGITTEVNGNCGLSAAPLLNRAMEKREDDLKEYGIRERWNTLGEYLAIAEKKGTALNLATLVGHGNIRGSVVGYDNREPTQKEMEEMTGLLKQTLKDGAIGLSTGLIYPPGIYSGTEELIHFSKVLNRSDHIYASHMRSEGTYLLEAVQEVIRIGREAGIKVHISHLKTAGKENWNKADKMLSLIHEARETGIQLTCDRYPYTASSTDLDSLLPAWTYEGGNEEEMRRLRNKGIRERIEKELLEVTSAEDYWNNILLSSVVSEKNKWMEGRTIADISKNINVRGIDFLFWILIEEKLRVGAIFSTMSEENLKKFLLLPFCMIGTDSSARCFDGPTRTGAPHPRGFGTFPKFLGKYIRDERLMSFSRAINKLTLLPAETFGLKGRGGIQAGMYADIVIFDPDKINDRASYDNPFQKPEGIYHVLVNGVPAVWGGKVTATRAGKILV